MPRNNETLLTRLHKNIRRNEISGCWVWKGPFSSNGQPVIGWKGELLKARRVIWTIYHGSVAGTVRIKMNCGNTKCVNPEHMELHNPGNPLTLKILELVGKFKLGEYFGDEVEEEEEPKRKRKRGD